MKCNCRVGGAVRDALVEAGRLGEFLHFAARYVDDRSLPKLYAFALPYQNKTGRDKTGRVGRICQ